MTKLGKPERSDGEGGLAVGRVGRYEPAARRPGWRFSSPKPKNASAF
jgi:hypothetical protein